MEHLSIVLTNYIFKRELLIKKKITKYTNMASFNAF